MHLTRILCFFVRRRHVPGLLYSGKHRVVPRITPTIKKMAVTQMVMEQKNLDVLDRPYLSEQEEYRHMVDAGIVQQRNIDMREAVKARRMLKHKSMEEHLNHLNISRQWE